MGIYEGRRPYPRIKSTRKLKMMWRLLFRAKLRYPAFIVIMIYRKLLLLRKVCVCDVLYADIRFCRGRASRGEFASRPMLCRTSPFARIATFSICTYRFLSSKPWTALEARPGSGDAAQGLIGTQGTKGGDRQHCKRLGRDASA